MVLDSVNFTQQKELSQSPLWINGRWTHWAKVGFCYSVGIVSIAAIPLASGNSFLKISFSCTGLASAMYGMKKIREYQINAPLFESKNLERRHLEVGIIKGQSQTVLSQLSGEEQKPLLSEDLGRAQIFPTGNGAIAQMGNALLQTLNDHSLTFDWSGYQLAPSFIRCKLKPHPGVKVGKVSSLVDDLQVTLGTKRPPLVGSESGFLAIDIPRPDRQVAKYEDYARVKPKGDGCFMAVGVDLSDQLVTADFSDPNTAHLLVGGCTGSGKSEWLNAAAQSLMDWYSPNEVEIAFIDPKRVAFNHFANSPHLRQGGIVKDSEDAIALFEELVEEMDDRYRILEKAGVSDVGKYDGNLPRLVVICDEVADLLSDKEVKKEIEPLIQRIGQKARAAGIHMILATQYPKKEFISTGIKANLPGRVGLMTNNTTEDMVLMGELIGTNNLLGKGDLYYKAGGQSERLQGLLI